MSTAARDGARTAADWVTENARSKPDRLAVVDGETRLSYAELDALVGHVAAGLVEQGTRPGDAVATLLPNSWQMTAAILATLRCGAVAVPLNPLYRGNEVEAILSQASPKVVISSAAGADTIDGAANQRLGDMTRVSVDDCPTGWRPFADWNSVDAAAPPGPELRGSSPAVWLYSSGSTGGSKRVSRTRAQLEAEAVSLHKTIETSADDVILCAVPLSHAHGLGNGLLASTYCGGTLVLHPSFDRRKFLTSVEADGVTIVPGSPFMWKALVEARLEREPDLSRTRLLFTAGAPLSRNVFDRCRDRFGVFLRQLYGSTETGAVSINLSEDIEATWDSVGAPLNGVDIAAFDAEGRRLSVGEEGSIGIKTPAMFDGYDSPELNAAALRDGYFFPGDRGHVDSAGRVLLTGRDTNFINVGGNKVDPAEVENLLGSHPKVREVVVLGAGAESGGEIVKAVIVPSSECEAAELLDHCRGHIADFKLPRIIEFRDEIPRNALGKVLRKYL